MGVHGAIVAIALLSPDFIHQLLTGIDAAWRVQQRFEQQKLVARQRQRLSLPADAGGGLIQFKLADTDDIGRRGGFLHAP